MVVTLGLGEKTNFIFLDLSHMFSNVKLNSKMGLFSSILRTLYFANCTFHFGHFYLLTSQPKVLENENCQKTQSKLTNNESGLGFFVPALKVPSFEVPTRALLAKVVILRDKKWNFQCQYKISDTTCIIQTFPKNEVYGPDLGR